MSPAEFKSRLTIVERVYHQIATDSATGFHTTSQRELETEEYPHERHLRIGENWLPLDCGHLEEASMLVIRNDEGKFTQIRPTEEELKLAQQKVLEVAFDEQPVSWYIHPQESLKGTPASLGLLRIRARVAPTRCTLKLYPR